MKLATILKKMRYGIRAAAAAVAVAAGGGLQLLKRLKSKH